MEKKQILTLIIGILIGGILTAAVFLIFKPGTNQIPDMNGNMPSFEGGERPNASDGENNKKTNEEKVENEGEE